MSSTEDLFDKLPEQPENATKPEVKKRTRKNSSSTAKKKTTDSTDRPKSTRTRSTSSTGAKKSSATKKTTTGNTRKTTTATKRSSSTDSTKQSSSTAAAGRRTVKAQSPAPSLESSRVKKVPTTQMLPKKTLPSDIPDMSNLTLSERLHALGEDIVQPVKSPEVEEKPRENLEAIRSSVRRSAKPLVEERDIPDVGHRQKSADRSRLLSILLIIVILLLLILLISLVAIKAGRGRERAEVVEAMVEEPVYDSGDLILEIRSGMNASQVARSLNGIVDEDEFLDYLKEKGLATRLLVGSYRVPVGISVESLATAITQKADSNTVRIYDGYTLSEIDSMLTNRGLAKGGEFLKAAERVGKERGLSFTEGYFLSGSYSWKGAYELACDMQDGMMDLLGENSEALLELDLSLDEVVKISSMVNRETQDRAQMALISGVILNRYRIGMPLGIDATTRYELGNWNDKLGQSVFEKDTPYNTRRRPGLPPTGIGCPGKDAVLSVLHPVQTDDMYYLHDGDGRLYTSLTYEEHLDNYDKVH